ncbi:hypothetical protein NHX12_031262 [Muraenolepis orangiensis]|uniref:Cytochrome P450 n=1 Tax=Muraenolepis orangiensis TaxID=630683 RepID=A0A9Q0E4Y0_9TELE|nr:hypothetical protein NHX12_031262 [Muraenolepis orangiensis]
MRRFATSALKDFGMGKKAIEEKIIEECQHLFEVITKKEGKPFDTDKAVNYAVSNIICSIVYGKRYQYDDKEFTTRVERALTHTQLLGSPLIQVQEELSRVIGSRQIRVEDRKNLPYTDAVIHETQRMADIVPMLNFCPTEDVTLQGFLIQKGTPVYSMLPSVHQDESEWESPSTFKPSRFLDKNGTFVKRDAFMVFSAGPRSCIGEGLARMEIFLFFSSLLQRFRFTPPPGVTEDELDLDPVLGLILSPTPHQLCAHPLHPT